MENDDYILRSDAVSAFCGNCEGTEICGQMGEPCDEVKRINAIPAADVEPQRRWTPATKPPKKNGRYICYYKDEDGECIDFGKYTDGEWYVSGVAFWMPLPGKPKKGEE